MELIICINCEAPVLNTSNFCSQCGIRVKCKECKTPLKKGDKFCSECGEEVNAAKIVAVANTVSFRKKGDEISYDVGLSNEVGKEGIKSLIESIAQSNFHPTIDIKPEYQNSAKEADSSQHINSLSTQKVLPEKKSIASNEPQISYPHIDDLLYKRKYNEMEWILIFAFVESQYGEKTFTLDQVRTAYLNKRRNDSRRKNFSQNWNGLRKTYFDTASEGVFRIEFDKLKIVSDFVLGNTNGIIKGAYDNHKASASKKAPKDKSETLTTGKTSKPSKQIAIEEFDIFKNSDKPSLQEIFEKFKPNGNKDIFGLIAYYICALNKSDSFTAGNIDYAYRILKFTRKNNLTQIVNNVKNETQWFEGVETGVWKLNRLGLVELESLFRL